MAALSNIPQAISTLSTSGALNGVKTPSEMTSDSSPLFLGLDLSTQQLKAIVTSDQGNVVHEAAVNFDRDLPRFGTKGGAIQGLRAGEVTSPVAMWVAAIDLLLERMKGESVEMRRIMGISGAGQVCQCIHSYFLSSVKTKQICIATRLSVLVS